MQAGAGGLADGVQSGEGRARVQVGDDPAHRVVGRRGDRDELARGVEPGIAQRGDHVGEVRGVDRAHVQADRAPASLCEAGLDRARDLVAGGELVDEALARGGIVQGRALAADRLGDQKALAPGEADHGGGVELQQLEVSQRRAGGVGEQQADPLRAGRVGGARPQRRGATRAEHDRARGDDSPVVADQAATAAMGGVPIGPQRARPRALEYGDSWLRGDARRQLANDATARRGAAGVDDTPDRVPALEAERESSGAIAVEADAERLQVFYPGGRLAHEDLGRRASDERAPGALGVGEVQLEAVVGAERRREAALRPVGGGLGEGGG